MKYLDKIIAITAMAGLNLLGIFLYESGCQAPDSDQDCNQNLIFHPKIIFSISNFTESSMGLLKNLKSL